MLDLCLKSIKENIEGMDCEIIVVDSEAKEKTRDFIKEKYPEVKIIPFIKNLGYSKIVNAGIKESAGKYILILNADIIVLKNAIQEMMDCLEKNPKVGILGPQLLDFTDNIQESCFANPTIPAILARRTFFGKIKWGKKALNRFTIKDWDRKSTKDVDWVQGSAMMIRKKALDEVGLWDERFFMYFEDADLCRRFWQRGLKVLYLPSARMVHYYHRSSKKFGAILDAIFNKQTRIHIISAIKYFLKYRKKK